MPTKPKTPPPVAETPSGFYVKIPVPPELAATFGAHVESVRTLFGELAGIVQRSIALRDAATSEALAVKATVRNVRRRKRR